MEIHKNQQIQAGQLLESMTSRTWKDFQQALTYGARGTRTFITASLKNRQSS